jgi:endoglucanase
VRSAAVAICFLLAGACAVPASSAILAFGSAPPSDPRGVDPASPNPLLGLSFFVDHRESSWHQWHRYLRRHRRHRAALMWKLASQPKFRWFGRLSRPLGRTLGDYLARARRAGAVPLIAVMRHQGKRCNRYYSGGGRREDARTRRWYRRFARIVGWSRVVIAFEPDSLGTVDCLKRSRRRARLELLRYGVDVLSRLPNATIYLEAGASDWEPARRTARQLRLIGIGKVRGFMLNATHYAWTVGNIRHGLQISRMVGGKPFIVSTSFNGRGPVHYRRYFGPHRWRTINVWCHPRMRGLGPPPTTQTSNPGVDAYLWVGRPGYSGGHCNGGPRVGAWWARRALMFARYATSWERPPRGTHYGLFRSFSARQLGAR